MGIPWQTSEKYGWWYEKALGNLNPDWWYNWKYDQYGVEGYIPMVYDATVYDDALKYVPAHEDLWLLFNEPERPDQAKLSPETAARLANNWPTQIAAPGIIVDESGLYWVQLYLQHGGRVPEYWAVHIYVQDGREWREKWTAWKNFMQTNNVVRPTIVTETGNISDSKDRRVSIMREVQRTMSNDSLLAGAAWFSAHYGSYYSFWVRSDLLSETGNLTDTGWDWIDTRATLAVQSAMTPVFLPNVSR